jgi:hypothetical protein
MQTICHQKHLSSCNPLIYRGGRNATHYLIYHADKHHINATCIDVMFVSMIDANRAGTLAAD